MKKVLMALCISILIIGCSRQQSSMQTYQGKGFYFTTESGELYEYAHSLQKINLKNVQSLQSSNSSNLHTSTQQSINILNSSGHIIFRHEPGKKIEAAAVGENLSKLYYVSSDGELKRYDRETNTTEHLGISLYPLPKQMILNEENQNIYYHDGSIIWEINMVTKTVSMLTQVLFPIQSIACDTRTNEIYFSTSTDGKIYKVKPQIETIFLVHEPISARGSSISIDAMNNTLYFSKTNGRDIHIQSMDLMTKEVNDAIVLYNINFIDQLVVKE